MTRPTNTVGMYTHRGIRRLPATTARTSSGGTPRKALAKMMAPAYQGRPWIRSCHFS